MPPDVACQVSLLPFHPNVVISDASLRATSDAARPTGGFLLAGFVDKNNWDAIQENTYVVLGHGPYQRRVLLCGILALSVLLLQYLAYRLIGRQVDHWCRAPEPVGLFTSRYVEEPLHPRRS
ncbi:hypothetical protein MTO96_025512 [Rhipicephalus appendiculatus]